MARFWKIVEDHRLAATWFLGYWIAAYCVHAIPRWNRADNAADIMPFALVLHLLLPMLAGGIAASWSNSRHGRILGGVFAGGSVLTIDFLLLQFPEVIDNWLRASPGGHTAEGLLEFPVFLAAMAGLGTILGLAGAGCTIAVRRLLHGSDPVDSHPALPPQTHLMRPRPLLIAGVLILIVAITTTLAVIPQVVADTFPQATPQRAASALRICAFLNAAAGLMILASRKYRSSGLAMATAVVGGFLAVFLGLLMCEGGVALWGHGLPMHGAAVIVLVCATANLVAGVLVLAEFRRPALFLHL